MYQRIQRLDRRTVLKASAGLFATGGGLALYSRRGRAEVTANTLDIPSRELQDDDGEIYAPWLRVSGNWEYAIDQQPDTWEVLLCLVADDGTRAVLDTATGSLSANTDEGTYTVSGSVTDAAFYSTEDFTVPTEGESKQVPLSVLLLFFVRNGDTILAKDNVAAEPVVKVTHAKPPALIGGTGQIGAQFDAEDTPTFGDG